MRARTEEEVQLGMAVLVSARCVNFGPGTSELLPCGSKSRGVAEHSFPPITQAVRLHQPWRLSSLCPQGGSGRLDYNKPPSSPGNCPCSFICRLFAHYISFEQSHDVLLLSLNWPSLPPGEEHLPVTSLKPHLSSGRCVPAAHYCWLRGSCVSSCVTEAWGGSWLL